MTSKQDLNDFEATMCFIMMHAQDDPLTACAFLLKTLLLCLLLCFT